MLLCRISDLCPWEHIRWIHRESKGSCHETCCWGSVQEGHWTRSSGNLLVLTAILFIYLFLWIIVPFCEDLWTTYWCSFLYFSCKSLCNQIDAEQLEKILKYIRSGIESGATLETGGERLSSKGYYVQPTVFSNVQVLCTPSNIISTSLLYETWYGIHHTNVASHYHINSSIFLYTLLSGGYADCPGWDIWPRSVNFEIQVSTRLSSDAPVIFQLF